MDFLPNISPLSAPFDFDQHYGLSVDLQMFGNDQLNDCVIAARAHHTIRLVWAKSRSPVNITLDNVKDEYHFETGTNDPTDGLDLGTSINRWLQRGWSYGDISVAPTLMHKIDGFHGPCKIDGATLPVDNPVDVLTVEQLQVGICTNAGAQVNLMLPFAVGFSKPNSYGPANIWTDTNDSSGDLHVMLLTGYDVDPQTNLDSFSGITWAKKQSMTWAFLQTHCWGVFFIEPGEDT